MQLAHQSEKLCDRPRKTPDGAGAEHRAGLLGSAVMVATDRVSSRRAGPVDNPAWRGRPLPGGVEDVRTRKIAERCAAPGLTAAQPTRRSPGDGGGCCRAGPEARRPGHLARLPWPVSARCRGGDSARLDRGADLPRAGRRATARLAYYHRLGISLLAAG